MKKRFFGKSDNWRLQKNYFAYTGHSEYFFYTLFPTKINEKLNNPYHYSALRMKSKHGLHVMPVGLMRVMMPEICLWLWLMDLQSQESSDTLAVSYIHYSYSLILALICYFETPMVNTRLAVLLLPSMAVGTFDRVFSRFSSWLFFVFPYRSVIVDKNK